MNDGYEIRAMTIDDYDGALALWQACDGVGVCEDDSPERIRAYIDRNPGFSLVAVESGRVVGTVLCGHDGRRGAINHLAVEPAHRCNGIGEALVGRCITSLGAAGILRCNIVVFRSNTIGRAFWAKRGWKERPELVFMQKATGASETGRKAW